MMMMMMIMIIIIIIIIMGHGVAHYGPGVDSASNRNEYQEYFLGVSAAGALWWQSYDLYLLIVLKSGSLHLLEPRGPVQGLFFLIMKIIIMINNNNLLRFRSVVVCLSWPWRFGCIFHLCSGLLRLRRSLGWYWKASSRRWPSCILSTCFLDFRRYRRLADTRTYIIHNMSLTWLMTLGRGEGKIDHGYYELSLRNSPVMKTGKSG
jgi:hypothetical protein